MAIAQQSSTNLDDWLTREQASDLLGVSYNTITRWERQGKLHPQSRRTARGQLTTVYRPAELALMPRRTREIKPDPGETCARVFEMLDRGHSMREIVIMTRETATTVEEWREQWIEFGDCGEVITPIIRAELARVVGPFRSLAELVKRIGDLVHSGNANQTTPGSLVTGEG